jgi:hypothetical protein
MYSTRRTAAIIAVALSLAGCGSTEPRPYYERRLGSIMVESGSIDVPSEGLVGVPVSFTVVTAGGGCVRQGDTEVRIAGLVADVMPYDSVYVNLPSNMACTSDLRLLRHAGSVTFALAGTAIVRIHGYTPPGGTSVVYERTVEIR